MSWMAKLYETYENVSKLDFPDENKLMPISHTLQNAYINIVIDGEGGFKRAEVLEKSTKIMLPATENSASRSSGEAPHPLADKLQYVAKDYVKYGGVKKPYFDSYEKLLRAWCESEPSFIHPKAKAVYNYITKGCIIEDLIRSKIVYVDDSNKLLTSWEQEGESKLFNILPKDKGGQEQGNALVCWTVEIEGDIHSSAHTWEDKSLQQCWIKFYTNRDPKTKEGLCIITGKNALLATNHPAKLRGTGDKAKLISSNDTSGYTYRGKFIDADQACGISFDVSQKAHNALSWLISRQGYRNGNLVVIAWAVSGKDVPSPMKDSYELFENEDIDEIIVNNEEKEKEHIIDHGRNLGQQFAFKLGKKIAGYSAQLDYFEKIILMGLDSATPGRMSITYYRESNAKEFFGRLESWHLNFAWPQPHGKEISYTNGKKTKFETIWSVSSPSPKSIAEAAYGQQLKEELKKNTIVRLLMCIIDGTPLPKDLVDSCVQRVSNPNAYEEDKKWHRDISIACALYKGYYSERNPNINERRNYQMSLERNRNSRDYLYGRLLALAENIEGRALRNADEKRITNAERFMQRFSSRPFTTWKSIDESLRPYRDRLKVSGDAGLLQYWEKEIQQICDLFSHDDFLNDSPLTGEYLLGYYCQKCYRKPKDVETVDEIDVITNNEIS